MAVTLPETLTEKSESKCLDSMFALLTLVVTMFLQLTSAWEEKES
jgi:hypothetical protein